MAVGDLDGDGFNDIVGIRVVTDDFSVQHYSVKVYFQKDGENADWSRTLTYEFGTDDLAGIALADLDNDGDLDLVVTNLDADELVYRYNLGGSEGGGQPIRFEYEPSICGCFTVPSKVIDELGRITIYTHDYEMRVIQMRRVVGLDDEAEGVTETDDAIWSYLYTGIDYDANNNGILDEGDRDYGLLDEMTDANGVKTRYRYDQLGRLITVIYAYETADEAQVSYTYDQYGNVASVTDELGHTTSYLYDIMNRLLRVTEADPDDGGPLTAPATTFTYDSAGNLKTVRDALGRTTQFVYDAKDRLVATINPLGGVMSAHYDDAGNITATTDELGRTTQYRYDSRGRMTAMIDPLGGVTRFAYDGNNNLVALIDPLGNRTTYAYDARNRLVSEVDPLGNLTRYFYDAADQLVRTVDAAGRTTRYEYNELGQMFKMTDHLGQTTEYTYDKMGNLLEIEDFDGNVTTYAYDFRYRLKTIIDANEGANQGTTSFTYYDNGLLESLTDPVGNTTSYVYDNLNRLLSETNELTQTRSFTYDAVGNLLSKTDREGRVTEYVYDPLYRLTTEKWKDGSTVLHTITYAYDAASQLTSAGDTDSTLQYTYDELGRVKTVTSTGRSAIDDVVLTSSYDAASRRTQLSATIDDVEDFTNQYSYDARSQMTRVTQSGNDITNKRVDFEYNALGQMTRIDRFEDLAGEERVATTSYSFDSLSRLTSIVHALSGAGTLEYGWTYDTLNRVATFTTPDGTTVYTYDNTSQLTGADHPSGPDEAYEYDANGNRTNNGYDVDPNNQMSTDGVYTYAYDDEGNRISRTKISDGEFTEYTWDYRNRLVAVDTWEDNTKADKQKGVRYTYDAFDRRIAKEIDENADGDFTDSVDWAEHFIYDGEDIALVFGAAGSLTTRYLHGPAIDQVLAEERVDEFGLPDEVYWMLADNLGSIRDVVTYDESTDDATHAEHIIYDAFGNIVDPALSSIDIRFGFTGREIDIETGLYYYRARYYDPSTGRFISEDPIGFAADTNFSRYTINGPTNWVDPLGLCVSTVKGWITSAYDYASDTYWNNPVSPFLFGGLAEWLVGTSNGVQGLDDEFDHNSRRFDDFLKDPANAPLPSTAGGGRRTDASVAVAKGLAEGSVNWSASGANFVTAAGAIRAFPRTSPTTTPNNYRSIFKNYAPSLPDNWAVHHTIPQQYRDLMRVFDVNVDDLQFLVGVEEKLHRKITSEWARFHTKHKGNPCAVDVAKFADEINKKYRDQFLYPGR